VLLNDNPGLIKVFNTLNYEGSQSKIAKFASQMVNVPLQPNVRYTDQSYYNLNDKKGWYVESIITNKEEGNIKEFIEKEGKWFNNINRFINISLEGADTSDFTFQGIGIVNEIDTSIPTFGWGCLNVETSLTLTASPGNSFGATLEFLIPDSVPGAGEPDEYNFYNWFISGPGGYSDSGSSTSPPQDIDHAGLLAAGNGMWTLTVNFYYTTGSCQAVSKFKAVIGCMNPAATNFDSLANVDSNACTLPPQAGCMDPAALNYNPNATFDDGSCQYNIGTGGA
jgi:hypothetical protein